MVANTLPTDHPPHPDPGVGVKIQLIQNMAMLHIKFKEMDHRAPCKTHFLTLHTP